jgi:hypothetical protein
MRDSILRRLVVIYTICAATWNTSQAHTLNTSNDLLTPRSLPEACSLPFASQNVSALSMQPPKIRNEELSRLLTGPLSQNTLQRVFAEMTHNGGLSIPVESGFVAAAQVGHHHGGYGDFLWFRDTARVYQGLAAHAALESSLGNIPREVQTRSAQRVRDVARGMVNLLADPQWTSAVIGNILDPGYHLDPVDGFRNVIWVRRDIGPFKNQRKPTPQEANNESLWGHKQNDALALLAHAILDALERKHVSVDDFSETAKLNLLMLPAYFISVRFWEMWDVGAWEEDMALRTSSVALVTSLLERFHNDLNTPTNNSLFFVLREHGLPMLERQHGLQVANLVEQRLLPSSFKTAIQAGSLLIQKRLDLVSGGQTRIIEAGPNQSQGTRFEDAALIHVLWHAPAVLDIEKQRDLVSQMVPLFRDQGIARYDYDWFLYGPAQAIRHASRLAFLGQVALPNGRGGFRPAQPEELETLSAAYEWHGHKGDIRQLGATLGEKGEAQWVLGDAILTQWYSDLYLLSHKSQDLLMARWHYTRLLGMVTGNQEFTSEGVSVKPWRLPEAYLPATFITENGPEIVHLISPNSPLNWSVAEFLVATEKLYRALGHERTMR